MEWRLLKIKLGKQYSGYGVWMSMTIVTVAIIVLQKKWLACICKDSWQMHDHKL